MKKKDFIKLINGTVREVLREVIEVPVQKDPGLMTSDEKKQAAMTARQKAGISDPNTPVDLVKNEEQEIDEMARLPITWNLAPDWEEKFKKAPVNSKNPTWYKSESRLRWLKGIINYIEENGPSTVKDMATKSFGAYQQMLNNYANELASAGVLVPAGIRGKEDVKGNDIVPQFMRKKSEPEPSVDMSASDDDGSDEPEGGMFGDPETIEKEPEGPSDDDMDMLATKSASSASGVTQSGGLDDNAMDILDQYDKYTRIINTAVDNLRKRKSGEAADSNSVSSSLEDLVKRTRAKLEDLKSNPHASQIINKYRKENGNKDANLDIHEEVDRLDESIILRFQKIANIKPKK